MRAPLGVGGSPEVSCLTWHTMPLFGSNELEIRLCEDAGEFYKRIGNIERQRLSQAQHKKLEKGQARIYLAPRSAPESTVLWALLSFHVPHCTGVHPPS